MPELPEYTEGMTARDVRLLSDADFTDGHLSTATVHLAAEMACHNVLTERFGADDASLGIHNDIWYWGDAGPGELLHAEAMIAAVDGRRIVFNVFVRAGIREIARGIHERMLVSHARFMASLPESPRK